MELVSLNPATGDAVGSVAITPVAEIPAIVARARKAQVAWGALSLEERAAVLRPAGDLLLEQQEALGRLLTQEMGKPLREGQGEVAMCGNGLAGELEEIVTSLEAELLEDGRTQTWLYRDAYGVCAAITPWNFPISMPHWLVIPSLMAGNSVVLKPSEQTPLIAQAYVEILQKVLPEDVLIAIHGGDEQGKALVAADVDLIAFTGSRNAGAHILEEAGKGLKRVILELGGKDPLVVLEDADIEKAAAFAVQNSFRNAGQVCVSTERIYVAAPLAQAFENEVVKGAKALKVGAGLDEGVDVGPMISSGQKAHVVRQVEAAVADGARVLWSSGNTNGNFLGPIVLSETDHGMDIMQSETFGPVACICKFDSIEECVSLANDSQYGLGAVVFGADEENAAAVARQLQAGMIGINRGVGGAKGSPWVGARQSGYSYHSGIYGHRQFAQPRIISRRL